MKRPRFFYVAVAVVGLVMAASLIWPPPTKGQAPLPDPFQGADAQIVTDFVVPMLNPVRLSSIFIGNADTSLTPSLSIADLAINPQPLTGLFFGNADAQLMQALVEQS